MEWPNENILHCWLPELVHREKRADLGPGVSVSRKENGGDRLPGPERVGGGGQRVPPSLRPLLPPLCFSKSGTLNTVATSQGQSAF